MTSDRRYYISVEVDLFGNPKVLKLGDALGFRHLRAVAWCHEHLTDGLVPRAAADALRLSPTDLKALVKAGLWKPTAEGWRVHDYLRHQPSRADMRRWSEAGRKAATARHAARYASDSGANRTRDARESHSESDAYVLRRPTSDSERYPEGGAGETDRSRDRVARTPGLRAISGAVDRVTAELGE